MMAVKRQKTAMGAFVRTLGSQESANCNARFMYPDKEMTNDDQEYDRRVE
ncbi:hypothetical protein ABER23_16005 [Paenibacillus lautus]